MISSYCSPASRSAALSTSRRMPGCSRASARVASPMLASIASKSSSSAVRALYGDGALCTSPPSARSHRSASSGLGARSRYVLPPASFTPNMSGLSEHGSSVAVRRQMRPFSFESASVS